MSYFERDLEQRRKLAWGGAKEVDKETEERVPESYAMTSEGYPKYSLGGVGFGGGTKTV